MIKHRFILRDAADFKVFAAIPVEASLLTWKQWMRPPDWDAFRKLVDAAAEAPHHAQVAFLRFKQAALELRAYALRCLETGEDEGVASLSQRMADHVEWAMKAERKVDDSVQELLRVSAMLPPLEAEQAPELFTKSINVLASLLAQDVDPDKAVERLRVGYDSHLAVLAKPHKPLREETRELVKKMRATFGMFVDRLTDIQASMQKRVEIAEALKDLLSSDPLPDTPCPPGLPFAAYTVEFEGTVVNVVEGCAGVAHRPPEAGHTNDETINARYVPTDEEKRVVEIVSQMLTERSLNPKADTKIPVREVNPAKAHQIREAEKRDVVHQRATVRTIKFEVTPPRYLREAAEHILTHQRRAHWVIGHWRNQPYGEKHTLRRQSWIKPHIRGLGEASATTSRVVAPRAGATP